MTTEQSLVQATTAAAAVTAASPFSNVYVVIALSATGGALWTMSRMDGLKPWPAAKLFFRSVVIAVVFTTLVAYYLASWLGQPVNWFVGPVAFSIAWVGDQWLELRDKALQGLARLVLGWKKS